MDQQKHREMMIKQRKAMNQMIASHLDKGDAVLLRVKAVIPSKPRKKCAAIRKLCADLPAPPPEVYENTNDPLDRSAKQRNTTRR